MKNKSKLSFIAASTLLTLLAYQNCSNSMKPLDLDSTQGGSSAPLSISEMETQALGVIANNCAACHNAPAADGGINYINDVNALKYFRVVIPGEPSVSPLYTVLTQDPQHMTLLRQQQMDLIFGWIQAGMSTAPPTLPPNIIPLTNTYTSIRANILVPRCFNCHGGAGPGRDFSTRDRMVATGGIVKPNDPNGSLIITAIGPGAPNPMPRNSTSLSAAQQKAIYDWIAAGALAN